MTDTGKEEQADEERAIRNASSGQTIQLSQDITCKKNGGDRIKVEGKTITLDLNGHTLYRNRTKKDGDGHVIEVKSKSVLTITDSKRGGQIIQRRSGRRTERSWQRVQRRGRRGDHRGGDPGAGCGRHRGDPQEEALSKPT